MLTVGKWTKERTVNIWSRRRRGREWRERRERRVRELVGGGGRRSWSTSILVMADRRHCARCLKRRRAQIGRRCWLGSRTHYQERGGGQGQVLARFMSRRTHSKYLRVHMKFPFSVLFFSDDTSPFVRFSIFLAHSLPFQLINTENSPNPEKNASSFPRNSSLNPLLKIWNNSRVSFHES